MPDEEALLRADVERLRGWCRWPLRPPGMLDCVDQALILAGLGDDERGGMVCRRFECSQSMFPVVVPWSSHTLIVTGDPA